jgi:hypothetical protein
MKRAVPFGKSQPCLCCLDPLTLITKTVPRPTPDDPTAEATEESWECTNQECISYRARHPKIPTPPLSK